MLHKIKYFFLNKFDDNILDFLKNTHGIFQLIDTKCVISEIQTLEAIRKTDRFMSHNEKIRSPGAILLMYIARTNQINVAIEKCGINKDTESGIVVYSDQNDLQFLIKNDYIRIAGRLLPYDKPEYDFEVFPGMAKIDLMH